MVPHNRATVKDVAAAAGVSVTTVSNVLNGRTTSMTAQTLERIQRAMADLGYRRNAHATNLVQRRISTIGLVIAEIETPLFMLPIKVIQEAAHAAGFDILVSIARSEETEQDAVNVFIEKDVAGVIFLSTSHYTNHGYLRTLRDARIPVVLVNRANAPADFDTIRWDNEAGIKAAVIYLASLGHTGIAHLCGPTHRYSTVERLRGYRAGLSECGLEYRPDYVQMVDYTGSPESWQPATVALASLPVRPTAIITANDTIAAVAIHALESTGIRVPQDMSIVGIDDQYFAPLLGSGLTTVRLPVNDAGKRAIDLLLARLDGLPGDVRHDVLDCPLIIRGSCSAPSTS